MSDASRSAPPAPMHVSDVTRYLRSMVEQDDVLQALSVQGEVSEYSRAASGHSYFTLKDSWSQISCVFFRREALQQPEEIKELKKGISVIVHGYLTLYEPRGSYQIYVERVVIQGAGAMALRFEQLRLRLEREGLFAAERKRSLPSFPRKLALVTSPGSQAYHDVLHRLRTQFPFVSVIEVGVSVQGEGAADEMVMALDIVNRLTDCDLILLVRGGGAAEDLVSYNEERLARAVFASRIPIVCGIGHETDYSIVDYVADVRAATPSLAAAMAVPDLSALVLRAAQLQNQSRSNMVQRLRGEQERLISLNQGLLRASPQNRVRLQRQRADELRGQVGRAIDVHIRGQRIHFEGVRARLLVLDPLAILERGYAVVTDARTGTLVSKVAQAPPGTPLRIRLADGHLPARTDVA